MRRLSAVLLCSLPLVVMAGDPIPGIGITVEQAPGYAAHGTTGDDGTVILEGLKPGTCVVTVIRDGQATVIGKEANTRVIIPGKQAKGGIKAISVDLARPAAKSKNSKGMAREVANHNTTRTNKTVAEALDTDDDGDSIPTLRANHNTTRDNRISSKALNLDDNCNGKVDITPMPGGRIMVKVSCG